MSSGAALRQNSVLQRISRQISIYQELSKSGIVALVLISVLGGYLAGQSFERDLDLFRLLITLTGMLCLASGSSALNQYQEQTIDAEMPRTAKRPLPSGRLTPRHALSFIGINLTIGVILLSWVSLSVCLLGVLAVISYNVLYTMWWKRHWAYAAIPGAIPGALPILMGYAAARDAVWTPGGLFLFAILFFWQMPHFWVLALRYRQDYEAGGVPTLPVAYGTGVTVSQIVLWCLAYVGIALLGPIFMPVGPVYLMAAVVVSAKLLWELRAFVREPESKRWLHFFLWVNFSLIIYIAAAVADLWSIYLIPHFTR